MIRKVNEAIEHAEEKEDVWDDYDRLVVVSCDTIIYGLLYEIIKQTFYDCNAMRETNFSK